MKHYSFTSIQELTHVGRLPFVCERNSAHPFYRKTLGSGWICSDRPSICYARDVGPALQHPLFEPGVRRIEELSRTVQAPAPRSRRRKPKRSAQGDDLDIQRVWQGDLEHAWTEFKREQTIGPSRILLVVDVGANCHVLAESMARRGTVALSLATKLQAAGFVVSLIAATHMTLVTSEYRDADSLCSEVCVLAPGQEIDVHKLANLIASALLFRGVLLDHTVRTASMPLSSGISRARPLELKHVNTTGFDRAVLIPELGTDEAAQTWLQNEIRALEGNNHDHV